MTRPTTLAERIKHTARELGFDLVGIAAAGPSQSHARYLDWLAKGYQGNMTYMARPDAVARRADLRELLPSARSVVVAGLNYYHARPDSTPEGETGRVARYAWGQDYHDVIADKLKQLAAWIETEVGHPVESKVCVDTSAVLEREWAVRAGLGWIGKNTLLINPRAGSWFLLGELLLDLELDAGEPFYTDHCGTCTRCLESCPTGCILPGRELDASRCISYLTIELRQDIPADLQSLVGDWAFGCDICQEVCPWNRFARLSAEPAFEPRNPTLDLRELATMDEETFRARFAHTPLRRPKLQGLARNAAAIIANRKHRGQNQ